MHETTREVWFESAGTRLFAVDRGRGRSCVFLHGGLADHDASTFRLGGLAEGHRLVTPDVRAAGRSIHRGALAWELLADDVAALLDHLELPRAVVGGVSAGSGIAIAFALRHPARVDGLVLVSPTFAGSARGATPAQLEAKARMNAAGQRALAEGIGAILPLYDGLPPTIRDIAVAMARGFDPASVAATTQFLASGAQPFASIEELARIVVPTIVVPGTDPEHPPELAALYARTLPRCTLVEPTADLAPVVAALLDATR